MTWADDADKQPLGHLESYTAACSSNTFSVKMKHTFSLMQSKACPWSLALGTVGYPVFTARRYAERGFCYKAVICLSVRLSVHDVEVS